VSEGCAVGYADGREVDVITGVTWAETGAPGIRVDGLFIVAPIPSRAEASRRPGARMTELLVFRPRSHVNDSDAVTLS
jgi:hypothetical protein